jgi:hypothetical protein
MKNIKTLICNEIITKGDRENIIDIINNILNSAENNESIDAMIDLYINNDKYDHETLFKKFKESVEKYYGESFYLRKCLAYLLEQEVKKILDKTNSYFDGFKNMIEIIKIYNRNYNLSDEENKAFAHGDIFAETISYDLSDILHDFDITEDVIFSEFPEDIAIKKINSEYSKSDIDNSLKEILTSLSEYENNNNKDSEPTH